MSVLLTATAHANLKNLRTEVMAGQTFRIPEVLNAILEQITVEQVRQFMENAIAQRKDEVFRQEKIAEVIRAMPVDKIEELLRTIQTQNAEKP